MKKIIVLTALAFVFIGLGFFQVSRENNPKQGEVKATDVASLSTDIQPFLTFSITTGNSVAFGTLIPGTPIVAPDTGTIASIATNAANGYTLGLSDGSDTDSALVHTDTTTHILDYTGSIATPTSWTGTGLGITLFAADSTPDSKWCTGVGACTTYEDPDNLYAGIPSAATTAHTVTGLVAGADTSSWAFKLDAPNDQKTGNYAGNVTFTATAVLS